MFAHWGTFNKNQGVQQCLMLAEQAMDGRGYQVWDIQNDGDYMVIGGNNDVIVNVTGVPQQPGHSWVAVSAYSSDSSIAELARNGVREYIVSHVIID